MSVVEIKRPEVKSSADVIGVLTRALDNARHNEIQFVSLQMCTKDSVFTDWAVVRSGSFCDAIGAVEYGKSRIIDAWKTR